MNHAARMRAQMLVERTSTISSARSRQRKASKRRIPTKEGNTIKNTKPCKTKLNQIQKIRQRKRLCKENEPTAKICTHAMFEMEFCLSFFLQFQTEL